MSQGVKICTHCGGKITRKYRRDELQFERMVGGPFHNKCTRHYGDMRRARDMAWKMIIPAQIIVWLAMIMRRFPISAPPSDDVMAININIINGIWGILPVLSVVLIGMALLFISDAWSNARWLKKERKKHDR